MMNDGDKDDDHAGNNVHHADYKEDDHDGEDKNDNDGNNISYFWSLPAMTPHHFKNKGSLVAVE